MNDTLPRKHIVPYGLGDWCPPGGNETIDCPIALLVPPLSIILMFLLWKKLIQKNRGCILF